MKYLVLALIAAVGFPLSAKAQSVTPIVVPTVANLSGLNASTYSSGTPVLLVGYYVPGDAPKGVYTLSTSACTISGGDGGSQIPATPAGCWLLAAQTVYDVRQWGAYPGPNDHYNNNATQINAAIAYASSTTTSGSPQNAAIDGGGLLYAIQAPIKLNSRNYAFQNISLLALATGTFPCATDGMVEMIDTTNGLLQNVVIDANRLAINGLIDEASGTVHADNITIQHWEGYCSSVGPLSGNTTNMSQTITMSNTANLAPGMVSRQNTGIPDLSIIIKVTPNVSITISKPATVTSTSSVPLTFDNDPSGLVIGFGGTVAGGTWRDINAYEWIDGDMEVGMPAYAFGYAVKCTGGCGSVALDHGLIQYGVSPIFMDAHTSGLSLYGALGISNGSWPSAEVNPPCIVTALGATGLFVENTTLAGCSIQANILDSTAMLVKTSNLRMFTAANETFTPNSGVQVFSDQLSSSALNVIVDTFNSSLGGFGTFVGTTGTYSNYPNSVSFGGTINNAAAGYTPYTAAHTIVASDCGQTLGINNGTSSFAITLPSPLVGVTAPFNACVIQLIPTGTGTVTLTPSGASLNGSASSITLTSRTLYTITTGNAANWYASGHGI